MSLSPRTKTAIQSVVGLVLAVGLLYLTFHRLSWDKIALALHTARYGWVVGAMAVYVAAQGCRAWRWKVLLRGAVPADQPVPIGRVWTGINIGFLVNVILPRVGEVVRAVSVNRTTGIPLTPIVATVIVERVLDTLCLGIILTLGLAYNAPELNALLPAKPLPVVGQLDLLWLRNLALLGVLTVLVVLALLVTRPEWMLRTVRSLVARVAPTRADGAVAGLRSFIGGFAALGQPRQYLPLVLGSLGVWGGYLTMLYLPLYAFDLPQTYGLHPSHSFALMAVTSLGSAIVPGGTGAYHFLCKVVLGAFGVPEEPATAYALVSHAGTTLATVGLGLVGLFYQTVALNRRSGVSPLVPVEVAQG